MTTIESVAESYFATLNPLTKKIHRDQHLLIRSYGEGWNSFDVDHQEDLLNREFIDPEIGDKYTSVSASATSDNLPDSFPKLNIPCGEKIIVDFDNEGGWTWTDEHSGPFSWKTKSQQDLTLSDLDAPTEESGDKKSKKSPTIGKKLQASNKDAAAATGYAFKPDKNAAAWETRYLSAESKSQAELTEAEEIFKKFGIAFSVSSNEGPDEEDGSRTCAQQMEAEEEEERKLLRPHDEEQYDNLTFDYQEDVFTPVVPAPAAAASAPVIVSQPMSMHHDVDVDIRLSTSSSKDDSSEHAEMDSLDRGKKKKSGGQLWKPSKRNNDRPETEEALMAELSLMTHNTGLDDQGQVSPVYIEDPGESTTDGDPTLSSSSPSFNYPEPSYGADEPPSSLGFSFNTDELTFSHRGREDNGTLTTGSSHEPTTTQPPPSTFDDINLFSADKEEASATGDTTDLSKSGFDFLDDW